MWRSPRRWECLDLRQEKEKVSGAFSGEKVSRKGVGYLFRASEIARRYAFCALLRGSSSPRTPTRLRAKKRVAVGTDIADRPPRRSVRALLTHTALTSDAWRQSARSGKPHCSCRMREFGLQAAIERQKPVGAGSAEKIRTRIQDCTCRASAKTKER